jgi:hypothetical protein
LIVVDEFELELGQPRSVRRVGYLLDFGDGVLGQKVMDRMSPLLDLVDSDDQVGLLKD